VKALRADLAALVTDGTVVTLDAERISGNRSLLDAKPVWRT
jgi:hypothetical protein